MAFFFLPVRPNPSIEWDVQRLDASADCGHTQLQPAITLRGREVLEHHANATRPWWASFDRRVAIVGLLVAVLGLAASLGLFALQ